MFEDSLLESGGKMKTRKGSTVFISAIVHIVLVTVLIIVPLIFTDQIEGAKLTMFVMLPPPPPPPAPPPPPPPAGSSTPKTPVVKVVPVDPTQFVAPTLVPKEVPNIVDVADAGGVNGGVEGGVIGGVIGGVKGGVLGGVVGGTLGGVLGGAPGGVAPPPPPPPPPPPAAVKPHDPIRVGGDVQAGNLLYHPSPTYPQLAKLARVEGSVILSATIAEDGTIKNLRIVSSSNQLLTQGVIDTVKTWKYKPTLLNKEPVEVITTITVNFTLGR